jgi:putative serine protease PepD
MLLRHTAGQDRQNGSSRWPAGLRRPRIRLLAAMAGACLACSLLAGAIGGYVAVRAADSPTNASFTLGQVPPIPQNRPAGSVAAVATRDTPAVVMIKVDGSEGTGSGFVIQGGYIVTDNHVITLDGLASNTSLRVYFSDGRSARAVLVGRDPFSDIAVIKAQGVTGLPALTLGNSASVAVGDPVVAIGSPLGLADTVTSGIVSAVQRPVQPGGAAAMTPQVFFDAIQTDAPINPGNSGGPLVNASGQVIGVDAAIDTLGGNPITGTQGGNIGLGFAIPIDQAQRVIVQLVRTGHATHPVIGAMLNGSYPGTGAQISQHGVRGQPPVLPGGPAAQAGLRPGDVITRFGNQPVSTADTLQDAIMSHAPGANVRVSFIEQGQSRQAMIRLGAAGS